MVLFLPQPADSTPEGRLVLHLGMMFNVASKGSTTSALASSMRVIQRLAIEQLDLHAAPERFRSWRCQRHRHQSSLA